MTARENEKDKLRFILETAFELLAKEPHPTIAGLRRRYYYRGKFTLMEHLSPKALAWNIDAHEILDRASPDDPGKDAT